MSRSKRRTRIFGITTAESDKRYKVAEHRRERRFVRAALDENVPLPDEKQFGDPWKGDRDGKKYWSGAPAKAMRK
jgi:hypothetical protein